MLKYMGPLIAVDEIAPSRFFYEQLLGQNVKWDFGPNVTFEGDFSIHLRSHLRMLMGDANDIPAAGKTRDAELCFETDEIDALYRRLDRASVEFVHAVQEQPWGQRVVRLYDPDGHALEIGETMEAVVCRLHRQGLSTDKIVEKTGMPLEFVEHAWRGVKMS